MNKKLVISLFIMVGMSIQSTHAIDKIKIAKQSAKIVGKLGLAGASLFALCACAETRHYVNLLDAHWPLVNNAITRYDKIAYAIVNRFGAHTMIPATITGLVCIPIILYSLDSALANLEEMMFAPQEVNPSNKPNLNTVHFGQAVIESWNPNKKLVGSN